MVETRPGVVSLLLALLCAGCAGPSLVRDLEKRGVTYQNTEKIIVQDSEGGWGADTIVVLSDEFAIQTVWDAIYQARPYSQWVASGYREIRFYTASRADKPNVILRQNASDEVHLKGLTARDGYRCPGLFDYLTPFLEHEYEKREAGVR